MDLHQFSDLSKDWKEYLEPKLYASTTVKRGYILEVRHQLADYFIRHKYEPLQEDCLPFDVELGLKFLSMLSQSLLSGGRSGGVTTMFDGFGDAGNSMALDGNSEIKHPYGHFSKYLTSSDCENSSTYDEEEILTTLTQEVVHLYPLHPSLMERVIMSLLKVLLTLCYDKKYFRYVNLLSLMADKGCLSVSSLEELATFARVHLRPDPDDPASKKIPKDNEFLESCIHLLYTASTQLVSRMAVSPEDLRELCKFFAGFLNESESTSLITITGKYIDKIAEMCGPQLTEELLLPAYVSLTRDYRFNIRKVCVEKLSQMSTLISDHHKRRNDLSAMAERLLEDEAPWVRAAAYEQLGRFILTFAQPEETGLRLNARNHVERIYPDQIFHPLYHSPLHSVLPVAHPKKYAFSTCRTEEGQSFHQFVTTFNGRGKRKPYLSVTETEKQDVNLNTGSGRVRCSLSCSIAMGENISPVSHRASPRKNARPISLIEDSTNTYKSRPPLSRPVPQRKRQYSAGDSDNHEQLISVSDTIHALHGVDKSEESSTDKWNNERKSMVTDPLDNPSDVTQHISSDPCHTTSKDVSSQRLEPLTNGSAFLSSNSSNAQHLTEISEDSQDDLTDFNSANFWRLPLPEVEIEMTKEEVASVSVEELTHSLDSVTHHLHELKCVEDDPVIMEIDSDPSKQEETTLQMSPGTRYHSDQVAFSMSATSSQMFNGSEMNDFSSETLKESNENDIYNSLFVSTNMNEEEEEEAEVDLDEIPSLFDDEDSDMATMPSYSGPYRMFPGEYECFVDEIDFQSIHDKRKVRIKQSEQVRMSSDLFNSFIHTPDCHLHECARAFAGVAFVLGVKYWHLLRPLFRKLKEHIDWKIRRSISFSLFELIPILGPHLCELDILPVLREYSRDVVDVREGIIRSVTKITRQFSQWSSFASSPSSAISSSLPQHPPTQQLVSHFSTRRLLVPWLRILMTLAQDRSIMPSVGVNKKDVRIRHILRGGEGPEMVVSVHATHWRQQLILLNKLRKCIRERLLPIAQWQQHIIRPLYCLGDWAMVIQNTNLSLLLHCVTNVRLTACRLLASFFHAAISESVIESHSWFNLPVTESIFTYTDLPSTISWVKQSLEQIMNMLLSSSDTFKTAPSSLKGLNGSVENLTDTLSTTRMDEVTVISEVDEDNDNEPNQNDNDPPKPNNDKPVFRPRQDDDGMLCPWRRRQTYLKLCMELLHNFLRDICRSNHQNMDDSFSESELQRSDRCMEILRILLVLWPEVVSPAMRLSAEDSVTNVRCAAIKCLKHVKSILRCCFLTKPSDEVNAAVHQLIYMAGFQQLHQLLQQFHTDDDVQVAELASISNDFWLASYRSCDTTTGALEDIAS